MKRSVVARILRATLRGLCGASTRFAQRSIRVNCASSNSLATVSSTDPTSNYSARSRQLPDYLGLTIETVSRNFTKLERDGVIEIMHGGSAWPIPCGRKLWPPLKFSAACLCRASLIGVKDLFVGFAILISDTKWR
jgi:hypothetical protein